jgi:ribosome modulation factor
MTDELTPQNSKVVNVGKFCFSPTGMRVIGDPTMEEWGEVGQALAVFCRGIQLCVGDWLRYGEDRYGELAAQYIDSRDWSDSTIRVYRWLSEKIPHENRFESLSVGHYMATASLPPAQQHDLLETAASDGWTVAQCKDRAKELLPLHTPAASAYWVTVGVVDVSQQRDLIERLTREGYSCQAARTPTTVLPGGF